MQLKTSFFNPTLYKKDLTRFWFLPLIYFVLLALTFPVSIWQELNYCAVYGGATREEIYYNFVQKITNESSLNAGYVAVMAGVFVVAVFSYLYSTKSAYMIHALPTSRTQLFLTGIVSSLTMLLVPQLITAVLIVVVTTAYHCSSVIVLYWLLFNVLYDLFFVGFASCVVMISGQLLASVVFYGIFNFLFLGMEVAIKIVASTLLEGFDDALSDLGFNVMTPIAYLSTKTGLDFDAKWDVNYRNLISLTIKPMGLGIAAIYAVVGFAFVALGLVLYRKKQMETVNDFITVKVMKWVFVFGMSFFVSIVAGIGISLIVRESRNSSSYDSVFFVTMISAIIIAVVLFFACQMLVDKSFRVFTAKRWKLVGIYVAYIVVFFIGFKLDFFNIASRLPEAGEVTQLRVDVNGVYVTEDATEIQQWMAIHKQLISDADAIRDARYDSDTDYTYTNICYCLKDGKKVFRTYKLTTPKDRNSAYGENCTAIEGFFNRPEVIKYKLINPAWDKCTAYNVDFMEYSNASDGYYGSWKPIKKPGNEELNGIYMALLKDIDEGNYGQTSIGKWETDNAYVNEIDIDLASKEEYTSYYNVRYEGSITDRANVYIVLTKDCKNLIQALIDTNIIESEDELVTQEQLELMYQ